MLFELDELLKKENNEFQGNVDITFDTFDAKFGSYNIRKKSPLQLKVVHLADRKITAEGSADIVFAVPCDRCLKDVDVELHISFSKKFDLNSDNDTSGEDAEDNIFITDNQKIDLGSIIIDEILVEWPSKVLCKDDCKGLCSVCGHDLNVGDCGCDRVVLDPRMAAIQDIFKNAGN